MKPTMLLLTLWFVFGQAIVFAQTFEKLDSTEQKAMADTFQYALESNPTNQNSEWINPDNETAGRVTPIKTYFNASGQPCREFTQTIMIGDKEEQGYGTACRQADGSWQIVAEPDRESTGSRAATSGDKTVVYVYDTPWPSYYRYSYYDPYGYWYPYYYPGYFTFSFNYIYHGGYYYTRPHSKGRYYDKRYPSYRIHVDRDRPWGGFYGKGKPHDGRYDRSKGSHDRYRWQERERYENRWRDDSGRHRQKGKEWRKER